MPDTDRQRYKRFLDGLALRHFNSLEVVRYADSIHNSTRNSLPPERMWPRIAPTLWVLDQLREYLGAPITLTSIYRSPQYNAAVGGAAASQHMQNRAIDFQVRGISPTVAFNRLVKFRQAGAFRGGLGRYSTFVHLDTRGENATWQGG